ncbi:hypothetical protein NQ318_016882 [Aromia moschata]|uniref:CCHC-type domain-containing protein n=1 Tax=Aromia moschata TaxID=1265417 RepID=A0AAV8XEY3_9CUCU|nr:hypothetical protein NQ318_016882 [Aromia moschata]
MTNQIVMTDEQFQSLISGMTLALSNTNRTSNFDGNFSKCASRFAGNKDEDVEAFIDAITVYKDCVNISDENAIRGLPMLLDQNAGTWWQGIKATILTWDDALTSLRHTFGFNKPPHKIFKELFSREQGDKESTDLFGKSKPNHDSEENKASRTRSKCSFCKNFGHVQSECRKHAVQQGKQPQTSTDQKPATTSTTITCFGCGKPGYIRSQCPNCRTNSTCNVVSSSSNGIQETTTHTSCIDVLSTEIQPVSDTSRPLIEVNIEGKHGLAYVDSGARNSIAGYKLYTHFCEMNLPYKEKSQRMVLADGQPRLVSTRIFEAIVVLQGRKIPTTFIAIPEHTNSKTLLGIDLISNARIILNIPKWHWYFEDNPFMTFDFFKECLTTNPPKTVDACQMEFQLSSNDGKNLSMEEKKQLEELVQAHSVVFEKNRPGQHLPTSSPGTTDQLPSVVPRKVPHSEVPRNDSSNVPRRSTRVRHPKSVFDV